MALFSPLTLKAARVTPLPVILKSVMSDAECTMTILCDGPIGETADELAELDVRLYRDGDHWFLGPLEE